MQADTPYRVISALRAVHASSEEHGFVTIPAGATLRVTGLPDGDCAVQVHLDGKPLIVCVEDLREKAAFADSTGGISSTTAITLRFYGGGGGHR